MGGVAVWGQSWCGAVAVWSSQGVEQLRCVAVLVWGSCSVGQLRCVAVVVRRNCVWGSFVVGELQCSVGELWGGGIVVGCILG